jgi:MATE family multidrug resistance protein
MSSDLIFMTGPLGIGVAASHRIGGLIGSGNAKGAKFVARIPYILSFIVGSVELIIIMSVKNFYGYIFSDSRAVVNLTAHVLPVIAFFQISDLVNGGAAGILRGVAKTHLAGISNLVAYYGVGLTSAYYLCFAGGMGLLGLWVGVIIGSLALAAIQTLWIALVNWEKEVENAANRLKDVAVVSH